MKGRRALPLAAALLAMGLWGCSNGASQPLPSPSADVASITVTADQLTNGRLIRPRYTCDGVNLSPAVSWSGPPAGTVATVLIIDDPDAPGGAFTHWLAYDIPASQTELMESVGGPFDRLGAGGLQGINDFGDLGYSGPCPPKGQLHTYEMHVYALERELGIPPRERRDAVVAAMGGAIIGHGLLAAPYQRQERSEESVVFKTPTPNGS